MSILDYDLLVDDSLASGIQFWTELQLFCFNQLLVYVQACITKEIRLDIRYVAKHNTYRVLFAWRDTRVCLMDVHMAMPNMSQDRMMLKFYEKKSLHLELMHVLVKNATQLLRQSILALLDIRRFRRFWSLQVQTGKVTCAQLLEEAYRGVLYQLLDNRDRKQQWLAEIAKNLQRQTNGVLFFK